MSHHLFCKTRAARDVLLDGNRRVSKVIILFLIVAMVGCDRSSQSPSKPLPSTSSAVASPGLQSRALPKREPRHNRTRFESLGADRTGIEFVHHWTPPVDYPHDLETQMAGGGVAIGDYDEDGRPDIYLSRPHGGNRLYRNLGDFRFEDMTDAAGVRDDDTWGGGVSFVDIDNDGDLDLFACAYDGPNRLFINQNNGTFVEQAKRFGLDFHGASVMMAFCDYDLDGDLDGYLLTNRLNPPPDTKFGSVMRINGQWVIPPEAREYKDIIVTPNGEPIPINAAQFDHLFRNDGMDETGQFRFTDVNQQAGIDGNDHGLGVVWWDYNDDGLPDLYVANDFTDPDCLYHNNGDGTFTNIIATALPHTPWFSMGTDAADINNDGRVDLMASDMTGTDHYKQKVGMGEMGAQLWFLDYPTPRQYMRNAVYLNTGTRRFLEVAYLTGLAETDWTWTVRFADLDEDTRVDAFVTNGMTRDWQNSDLKRQVEALGGKQSARGRKFWQNQSAKIDRNLLFRNHGDLRFHSEGAAWGLDHNGVSFGAATGDLDGDGDLDLVVNNFEEHAGVYRNLSSEHHRIVIRLKGTQSNRFGLGTKVQVETKSGGQRRDVTLARGFMSAGEPMAHFGLGRDEAIGRLKLHWPSGLVQSFENLPANREYTITEPATSPAAADAAASESTTPESAVPLGPIFQAGTVALSSVHREQPFDDFKLQPLLPNRLSQLGPGMACGDIDGDGDDDLFHSGAAGQPGTVLINQNGRFVAAPGLSSRVLAADRECEDMGPLLFDADSDGDLDLYVVSGGIECEAGSPLLQDRLYLNDGQGQFTKAPADTLPNMPTSGSMVVAADYDRDGDLDLFVGGRVRPGSYPLAPQSYLLRNDHAEIGKLRFTVVTDEKAIGLSQLGMVTGALWTDTDRDGWLDLMVTYEWGPIRLWRNHRGQLTNVTESAGLSERTGWWNGIAGRDLDNDGDIDYVVTNFGLNTKYEASATGPVELYYGDFDASGQHRLVEAEYEGQKLYPVRGRSCSSHAIPIVGQRFTSYHDFALASLSEIYTLQCLQQSHRFSANTLDSGILINDGRGRFEFHELPRIAQASPSFGVVSTDFDGDGRADIYLAQNFFGPQVETGRMDGGVSLLLRGQGHLAGGNPAFTPVWPDRSGIVVAGDATSALCTDANGDGLPDLLVAVNNGRAQSFQNLSKHDNQFLSVYLQNEAGSPAVGAYVEVILSDQLRQAAEVYAGSGYLSQSTHVLTFGLGSGRTVEHVKVRWADHSVTEYNDIGAKTVLRLRQNIVP